jgi:hypothetical protein
LAIGLRGLLSSLPLALSSSVYQYGFDMDNPDPKLKGIEGGNCNRTACQSPFAIWYNESTRAFYCRHCAILIQRDANDYAQRCQEEPVILFKGIFDRDDPRHKQCDNFVMFGMRLTKNAL